MVKCARCGKSVGKERSTNISTGDVYHYPCYLAVEAKETEIKK